MMNRKKEHSWNGKSTLWMMYLIIAVTILIAGQPQPVQAQWTSPDTNGNINTTGSGNVGVGTTTPTILGSSALGIHIRSSGVAGLRLDTLTGGGRAYELESINNGNFGIYDLTAGSYRLYVLANGKVGIGTTSPEGKLEIAAPSSNNEVVLLNLKNSDSSNVPTKNTAITVQGLDYQNGVKTLAKFGIIGADGVYYGGADLTFSVLPPFNLIQTYSPVERMRITAAGNVGIGTANPQAALDISQSQTNYNASFMRLSNTDASGQTSLDYYINGTLRGKVRADYAGNVNYVANGGTHNFFLGGDYGVGAVSTVISSSGVNVTGTVNASGGFCIAGDCRTSWSQIGGGGGSSQWTTSGSNIYYSTGSVGIGTASPGNKLQIAGGDASYALFGPNATWGGYLTVGSGNPGNGALTSGKAAVISSNGNLHLDAGSGQNIYIGYFTARDTYINANGGNVGIGTATPQARLDVNGNINVSGNINAKYQDVAEWVPSSQKLSAGTVVILDPERANQVIASGEAYDTRVAGVVSDTPGVLLGEGGEGKLKVATTGRVRVKVDATNAPIKIGDLLVTSNEEGVAMKSEPMILNGRKFHAPGTIIGKALEPLEKGKGEILVLLSLQ
jgi:hypothetical protein